MSSLFQSSQWESAVDDLKRKAANFLSVYDRVKDTGDIAASDSQLYATYSSLVNKGDMVKASIEKATQAIDGTIRYAGSVMDGMRPVVGVIPMPQQLGFLPLVPVAVIMAASAGITYWVNDALQYLDKVERVEQLQNQGVNPGEAYSMVYGSGFNFKKALPWIVGIVGGVIIYRIAR